MGETYNYKYKTKVITVVKPAEGDLTNRSLEDRTFKTAEGQPTWTAPIEYDKDGKTAYIYSNKGVGGGLEIVDRDVEKEG